MQERRKYLEQYIIACVRDSVLTLEDLLEPDKIFRVIAMDAKVVLRKIGKDSIPGLVQMGSTLLAGLAEKVIAGKRR